MKRTALLTIFSLAALLGQAATQPVELLPFAFTGRIVDYAHVAYRDDLAVEIRVKATDGTLLAKTTTRTLAGTVYNYAVWIPLASQAITGHVTVGDPVVFEFVDPEGRVFTGLVPADNAKVGNPGERARVDVILASDANGDGVADEYVESLEYMMWLKGIAEYDPNADDDKDGQTNYQEYVAGTNPFDPTDRFSVREMAVENGMEDYIAFRVLVNQGRDYTVETTASLDTKTIEWVKTQFSVADPSAALQGKIVTGPSETGYRTIYVKKDGPQRFWKLNVE